MLKFWLDFMRVHQEVLLHGKLTPYHPELNYPLVVAETETEMVIAVYGGDLAVPVPPRPGKCCWIINGSGSERLLLDAAGRQSPGAPPVAGLSRVRLPKSGLLGIQF